MPLTEEPDYTKYSLDELYEAARHNDGFQYPERDYQLAIEIEKRIGKPVKKRVIERLRVRPWREWIFEYGESPRNATSIMEWWEKRRAFYIRYFFVVSGSNTLTLLGFGLITVLRNGSASPVRRGAPTLFWHRLIGDLIIVPLWLIILFGAISILYVLFWVFDGLLNVPLKFLGWRLSVALFQIVLVATFLVMSFPTVLVFVSMLSS